MIRTRIIRAFGIASQAPAVFAGAAIKMSCRDALFNDGLKPNESPSVATRALGPVWHSALKRNRPFAFQSSTARISDGKRRAGWGLDRTCLAPRASGLRGVDPLRRPAMIAAHTLPHDDRGGSLDRGLHSDGIDGSARWAWRSALRGLRHGSAVLIHHRRPDRQHRVVGSAWVAHQKPDLRPQIPQLLLKLFGPPHLRIHLAIDIVDVLVNARE